ncbi:MAG: hypothetical protein HC921_19725 [Synechococcaceae cyanobacterium SM2_3_1]|nr:hypothetical protein [Synechococcaceae cyanobacterium SM2_3_1]
MTRILDLNQPYTFSHIFELRAYLDDVVADFGYTLARERLTLPTYAGTMDRSQETRIRIEDVLPYVDLANETTRREMIIAPIISDLVHYTQAQLRIEYPIKVNLQLQGFFDYHLNARNHVIIIEAKQEDLYNGFTQLAAELIALDQWDRTPPQPLLLGAVTTGTIWQFGRLQREAKLIEQDLNLYQVPDDLEMLSRILVQALLG